MNAITTINTPLFTIADTAISIVDGLYSLNDLHKASGNQVKHKPSNFMQNQETKDLIAEINGENSDDGIPSSVKNKAFRVIKGGNVANVKQGTYVCKELVYRYAMWISAKFSLIVIRAFDSLVSRTDSKQREALITACDKLAVKHALRSEVYTMVANEFGYDKVTQIPTPLLPEAIAFTYEMYIRLNKSEPTTPQETNEVKMFWKCVGLHQYHETDKLLSQLQKVLWQAEDKLKEVNKSRSLIYDALAEPRHPVGGQTKVQEINQKALAFITRQNAMKA